MCSMFVKLLILHPLIPVAMGGVLPTVGIPLSNGMRPGRDLPPCLCLHLLLLCPPWLSAALRMPLLLLSAFWRMWPLLCSSCGRNPAKVRRQAFKSLSPVATQTRQGASYNLRALHHTHTSTVRARKPCHVHQFSSVQIIGLTSLIHKTLNSVQVMRAH